MSLSTNTRNTVRGARGAARLRLAALVTLPVLAFSVGCGGEAGGTRDEGVATVPGESAADSSQTSAPGKEQPAGGKGAFFDAQMKYVQCMRSKGGVKDFPDPKLSGYLDWAKIDEVARNLPPGAASEAVKGGKGAACGPELQAAMQLEPPRDTQKDYESMLAHASCMREKGVSKFTNPTLSSGNVIPGGDPSPASPQIDRESPAYKQAREACKDKLLDGLDGMQ
ncbi:hypothetical protein [Streptomyces sp. NPDC002054]|uniref:hypothetical protein n=1 Tax=Streptomyces sp. NPDC002054 TaxID=3154663 RepID=UPI00332249DD